VSTFTAYKKILVSHSLAVVIPCRNEEKYIGKCLDSIISSSYSKAFLEVYVCDGRSEDATASIVKDYSTKHPFIHLLINEDQTTPHALNLGVNATQADYITILGAHAEVSNDYLSLCVSDFEKEENIGCTGGLLINEYEDKASQTIGLAQSSPFGVGDAYFRTGLVSGLVDTVAFGTYKKEVFEDVGLFDSELVRNQDDEFNFRLKKAGYNIYLNSENTCIYYVRASFKKLFNQYWQYGYWKVFVNKKHSTITTLRQLIPALMVLVMGFLFLLSWFHIVFRALFLLTLVVYLGIGLVFASQKTDSPGQMTGVIKAFICLHYGYGLGYLKGIWDFIIKRKSPSKNSQSSTR